MDFVNKKQHVYIAGKGHVIDLGFMDVEKIAELKNMSEEARQKYIYEYIKNIPEALKTYDGFCEGIKKHVTVTNCINCGKEKGFTSLAQLEYCRLQNIRKY